MTFPALLLILILPMIVGFLVSADACFVPPKQPIRISRLRAFLILVGLPGSLFWWTMYGAFQLTDYLQSRTRQASDPKSKGLKLLRRFRIWWAETLISFKPPT